MGCPFSGTMRMALGDIACVWQDSSPKGTTTASLVGAKPMASFSETVRPLGAKAAEAARSVA